MNNIKEIEITYLGEEYIAVVEYKEKTWEEHLDPQLPYTQQYVDIEILNIEIYKGEEKIEDIIVQREIEKYLECNYDMLQEY